MATFIELTCGDGQSIMVNLDLIKTIEPLDASRTKSPGYYPNCKALLYGIGEMYNDYYVRESLEEIKALWEATRWIP